MPFERAIEELESIVKRLEEGKVPLEESVAIYERGEALKRRCEDLLRQAEARVRENHARRRRQTHRHRAARRRIMLRGAAHVPEPSLPERLRLRLLRLHQILGLEVMPRMGDELGVTRMIDRFHAGNDLHQAMDRAGRYA